MKKILDEYLANLKGNEMNDDNKKLFCSILIKRFQQIQAEELKNELISVEMQTSDKSIILKFNAL